MIDGVMADVKRHEEQLEGALRMVANAAAGMSERDRRRSATAELDATQFALWAALELIGSLRQMVAELQPWLRNPAADARAAALLLKAARGEQEVTEAMENLKRRVGVIMHAHWDAAPHTVRQAVYAQREVLNAVTPQLEILMELVELPWPRPPG